MKKTKTGKLIKGEDDFKQLKTAKKNQSDNTDDEVKQITNDEPKTLDYEISIKDVVKVNEDNNFDIKYEEPELTFTILERLLLIL